jgi:DNA helicase-2/ATP-dependent DNA helicase PcrA
VGLLADVPAVADAVRGQYHRVVVDEYQDVSPLQQALLDLWLGERDDVCVVGDASQTIYSFTGATPDYLLGFSRRYPDATVVRLVRDYRSTPQVVALANLLLERAGGQAARTRLQLLAQRPAGPAPEFREYPDEPAEATGVAARIRRLIDSGVRASEVAVLFRTNAQSESFEQALADAGVPYLLRGGQRFFERPEIRQAHLLLRGAARSAEEPGGLVAAVRAVLSGSGWSDRPPGGAGAARDKWESLAALVTLAEELAAAQPEARLGDLVSELDERAAAQHAPTVDGVTLASLHAAKGLEWDAVFLVGLTEGMVPITYAETPEAVEEERRLLYVGVTRAREHLALSWSLARSPGGRGQRRPSRFLDGLRPDGSARGDRAGPGRGRGRDGADARGARGRRTGPVRCRVCGRQLTGGAERKLGRCVDCPATYDEELFARLRDWRMARSKEASVPAYVVFTDATLTAIAEARPTSPAELSSVPGVGAAKLERYAGDVLALVRGEDLTADRGEAAEG